MAKNIVKVKQYVSERPRKPRLGQTNFTMTCKEKKALKKYCHRKGITMSNFIRKIVKKELKRKRAL